MLTLFFFLFGTIIGSFLNVVALRLERGQSLGGRSHCPHCEALIRWFDNVPLFSFAWLRGRCRQCRESIAWQYPAAEFGTGLVFALIGTYFFAPLDPTKTATLALTLGYLVLASLLIVVCITDLRTMEIPLAFLVAALGGALLLAVGHGIWPEASPASALPIVWGGRFAAGILAAAFFYGLVFFSHETWMGMGDVWLAATFGLMVGAEVLILALTISFFFGALVGGGLLWFGRATLKSQVPFAPFLIVGLWATLFLEWSNPHWLSLIALPLSDLL